MIQQFIESYLTFILGIFALTLVIIIIGNVRLLLSIKKLKKKNEEFFAGGKVHNLEELLLSQAKNLKLLDRDIQELYNISNQINSLALRGTHKIGLIRFNPFHDVGGDQSFALAILNGKNNGLTLSSLYTREGTRVYAKSIINGESEKHPLTEEEKKVIKMAIESEEESKKKSSE